MMDLQGFSQIPGVVEGNTQILPPIQGNTQVLPTISPDGYVQRANTILQETAGLAGPTDGNGFFGTTTNTNDIFGETLKTNTEATEFQTITGTAKQATPLLGENQYIQNVDTNTFFGATGTTTTTTDTDTIFGANQIIPGTSDPNSLFTNQTLAGTQFLTNATTAVTNTFLEPGTIPTTTTDATTLYGTTQIVPDATAFGNQIGGITNTTNGGFATQNEYPATGITTPDSQIGYGTTAADLIPTQQTYTTTNNLPTTYEMPTTTVQTTTQTAYENTVGQQTTTVTIDPQPVETQIQNIPQTVEATPIPVASQNQIVQNTPQVIPQPQAAQTTQQRLIPNPYGARIIDEDFRRGRPIYSNNSRTIWKLNKNIPVRPSYNVDNTNNSHLLNLGYNNTGFGYSRLGNGLRANNITSGTGLDRLGRGGSYDVYSRGINPLLNKTGLGQTNNAATSNLKDFL